MTERIEVMISEEEVNAKIRELAEQISHDYAGKTVHLITILKGGVFFAAPAANEGEEWRASSRRKTRFRQAQRTAQNAVRFSV